MTRTRLTRLRNLPLLQQRHPRGWLPASRSPTDGVASAAAASPSCLLLLVCVQTGMRACVRTHACTIRTCKQARMHVHTCANSGSGAPAPAPPRSHARSRMTGEEAVHCGDTTFVHKGCWQSALAVMKYGTRVRVDCTRNPHNLHGQVSSTNPALHPHLHTHKRLGDIRCKV